MPLDYDNMNKSLAGIENMQMARREAEIGSETAAGSSTSATTSLVTHSSVHSRPWPAVLQNAPLPTACAASAIDRHGSRVMIARVFARISGYN